MSALMSCARTGMARAKQGTIGQNDGRCGLGHFEAGDRDSRVGILHLELDVPQAQGLAGMQLGFTDGLLVEESAIGRIAIPDDHGCVVQLHLTMASRDGGVVDLEFSVGAAPQPVYSQLEFEDPVLEAMRFYEQVRHNSPFLRLAAKKKTVVKA
jgi:hypothetical protein